MPDVELTVNGLKFSGWKTARVTRTIEAIAGGFELTVSDRWRAQSKPWAVYPEDVCALSLNGVRLVNGYVDRVDLRYSATDHGLSVSGRDKTAALVDNSVYDGKWEYLDTPPLAICQRVAHPFGVAVRLQSGLTLPKLPSKVSIDPGDTPFDVIERVCRKVGVLAVSDGGATVLLTRPGSTRTHTALIEGRNILSASGSFDAAGRYRRYMVLGQHYGTDAWAGGGTAAVVGDASDTGVLRSSRVLVVRPEGAVTTETAKKRAQWEATVRAARADSVTVTVQGWTQGNGEVWPVNAIVSVVSPSVRVDGEMLITQAVYEIGPGGTTTEITLRDPESFTPEPRVVPGGWKEIRRGV